MYEATFRIAQSGAYAASTAGTDTTIELWCNDHCDLLHVSGDGGDAALERVRSQVGIRDRIEEGDERLVITEECLKTAGGDPIERYLACHGCLLVPPLRYADGAKVCRVLALDGAALTAFYRDIVDEHSVTVEAKREIDAVRHDAPLLGPDDVLPSLSPRQAEVLATAREMDYYEIPRETTTAEIAAAVGVERRTAEEHLRRAENKLVESVGEYVDGGGLQ